MPPLGLIGGTRARLSVWVRERGGNGLATAGLVTHEVGWWKRSRAAAVLWPRREKKVEEMDRLDG